MGSVSKSLCIVLILALIGHLPGCASTTPVSTDVPTIGDSEIRLHRYYGEGVALGNDEVLVFGRLQVIDEGSGVKPDLSFDAALFVTARNAPHSPIPLWSKSALRKASKPFETDKDGFFAAMVPKGSYRLQVVYRSPAGWLAIDPSVQIETGDGGAAVYVGEVRIDMDSRQIAKAKASRATTEALRVDLADEYDTDYTALTSAFANSRVFPVRHSPMIGDPKARPSAIVSTAAPPAGSDKYPVIKVLSTIALVALAAVLFAAYLVVAILGSGNWTMK
jgi:hypothetical protein